MTEDSDILEDCVYEGRIAEIFKGFRNYDTLFKFQGGEIWRQDEYTYEYHHLFSPKAKIIRIRKRGGTKETFYIEIDGVKTRVKVKAAYV